jgi:GNAT superfamily N-acetyltransferase
MRSGAGWVAVAVDDLEAIPWMGRGPVWRPLRHALDARIAGMNVYTADRAGEEVIETHAEAGGAGRGHEEVYAVLAGAARFALDARDLDAPAGTFIRVAPEVRRGARALEPGTAVLALGGPPSFDVSASEWIERARAQARTRPERAEAIVAELREQMPGSVGVPIAQALLADTRGDEESAARELREVLEREPSLAEHLMRDPDLGAAARRAVEAAPDPVDAAAGEEAPARAAGVATRPARADDLGRLLALLSQLEEEEQEELIAVTPALTATFARILADRRRTIVVAESRAGLVGTLDVVIVENLTREGAAWAAVENVVVDRRHRGRGVGRELMGAAERIARDHGCFMLQLVSGQRRAAAHALYEAVGYDAPVRGFRRYL